MKFRIIQSKQMLETDNLIGNELYATNNVMQADCKFAALVKRSKSNNTLTGGKCITLIHKMAVLEHYVIRREYAPITVTS